METKPFNISETSYNTCTLIAKKNGFVYPAGHSMAGRMNQQKTMEHILKVYAEATA